MRLMTLPFCVILAGLLAACAPSETAVQQAIEETTAAQPAATMAATEAATATAEPSAIAEPLPTDEPRATAEVTATSEPTAEPLGEIDLGSLLVVGGDLPEHLDGEPVQHGETFRFDREDLEEPDNLVSQQFYDSGIEQLNGGVAVYVYGDETAASQAYGAISTNMTGLAGMFSEIRDDVGERARLEQQGEDLYHLAFLRCHAFVEVFMHTPRESDIVVYAQRLDARLGDVVCSAE